MISRFLLAFGLASTLMPMGIAMLTPAISGHDSINTAGCDPIQDPQGCPKVYMTMKTKVPAPDYSTLS
jgi:hypothetical protein